MTPSLLLSRPSPPPWRSPPSSSPPPPPLPPLPPTSPASPRARSPRPSRSGRSSHHREDQAPVRELRQVRPAVRLRRAAPSHRQRRSAALGRVRHPGPALPLHRWLDRVGRAELPDRHPGRKETHHEGDHHRRAARHQAPLEGLHLASGRVQGTGQRGAHRQRRVIRR
ncbi:hypothetical protein MUK42_06549 [Musa troglodytarum]|uniref:Uncharacterized protein n=1 Tax=Musa troglodytarum TaxID=320322 RepID=A0A9E7HS33_9LILI|nr:hypothetical protein MUK42_06549 [Musa troglodytarum]